MRSLLAGPPPAYDALDTQHYNTNAEHHRKKDSAEDGEHQNERVVYPVGTIARAYEFKFLCVGIGHQVRARARITVVIVYLITARGAGFTQVAGGHIALVVAIDLADE